MRQLLLLLVVSLTVKEKLGGERESERQREWEVPDSEEGEGEGGREEVLYVLQCSVAPV